MAHSISVRNASGESRTLNVTGDRKVVKRDGVIDVPPELAGRAPAWREATPAEAEAATDHGSTDLAWRFAGHPGDPEPSGVEVFDLGVGMLAQPANWRAADDQSDPADPTEPGWTPPDDDGQPAGDPDDDTPEV